MSPFRRSAGEDFATDRQRAMATLRGVLQEIGWDEGAEEEEGSIFVELHGTDVPVAYVHLAVSQEADCFVSYVVLRVVPPIERRGACASHIVRVNHDVLVGGFDLDFDTGRLSFKTGVSFRGDSLRAQQIRNVILASLEAVEHYGNEIVEVASDVPARSSPSASPMASRPSHSAFAVVGDSRAPAPTTIEHRARDAWPGRDP